MSASNEIRFKIGADTSALSRAFSQAESVAASAGQAIHKKLGMKDAFKSTLLTLGLSIEKISEKIAGIFTGGDPELWKAALDAANDSARIIEESTLRRMSTVRQIGELEKKIARGAANEDATPKAQKEGFFATGAKVFDALGMKNAAASFRRTAVESPAEAAARAAVATRDRLADEARIAELKDKQEKNTERIAAARRELDRLGLTGEEKIAAANEDIVTAEEALEAAKKKGADTTEIELDLIAKIKKFRESLMEQAKELSEFRKKESAEERADHQRRLLEANELANARGAAANAVNNADQANQGAKRDALAFTVGEAAGGKRGNPRDRAAAKAIERDEATARRLFDSGNTLTQFNSATGKNEARGAEFFQDRALQLRGNFDKLKGSEQAPFAGTEKRLDDAILELQSLNEKLAPEAIQ